MLLFFCCIEKGDKVCILSSAKWSCIFIRKWNGAQVLKYIYYIKIYAYVFVEILDTVAATKNRVSN